MKANGSKRERGAYYTPEAFAKRIAEWAIRSPTDIVIDPAAGRGALLMAAVARLRDLGGDPGANLWGVELHNRSYQALHSRLTSEGIPKQNVFRGDFFNLWQKLPRFSVILTNPPYVRHQSIPTRVHGRMREAVTTATVTINGRASSWAYFLAASPLLLLPGGRMAAILPTDILTSDYRAGVLELLQNSFASVDLCYCDGRVFDGLNQRTVLCLADGFKPSRRKDPGVLGFRIVNVDNFSLSSCTVQPVRHETISADLTLGHLMAPETVRKLDQFLKNRSDVQPLGKIAKIKIGYVTGDNDFFHWTDDSLLTRRIGHRHVTKIIRRERDVDGIRFTRLDWKNSRKRQSTRWLLTPRRPLSKRIRGLLLTKRARQARTSSHCRRRTPWWQVPLDAPPAAFMIYMGDTTRIVANAAKCQVSNSFFRVSIQKQFSARDIAVASLTSVFRLSSLLNCRFLGGGLRKLEPSDAVNVLLPCSKVPGKTVRRIDDLVRMGRWDDAYKAADKAVLLRGLNWEDTLISELQKSVQDLKDCFLSSKR